MCVSLDRKGAEGDKVRMDCWKRGFNVSQQRVLLALFYPLL
jgi:hypothetical protein